MGGGGVDKPSKAQKRTCLLSMILLSTERKKKSKGSERARGRERERKRKQMKTENIQVAFDSFTVCCAEWDV